MIDITIKVGKIDYQIKGDFNRLTILKKAFTKLRNGAGEISKEKKVVMHWYVTSILKAFEMIEEDTCKKLECKSIEELTAVYKKLVKITRRNWEKVLTYLENSNGKTK